MENLKLNILRIVLMVALFSAWVGTFFVKREKHFPIEWLLHYVAGTGADKKVPKKVMKEFIDSGSFKTVLEKNYYSNTGINGRYALTHSLDYEGRGFENRPQLFYIVGCFCFNYDGNKIAGNDTYDWHESEDGRYYTSPLGKNKFLIKACDIMGRIFGDDLFVTARSSYDDIITMEEPGSVVAISNKLWWALSLVGAKEFKTVIEYDYVLDSKKIAEIISSRDIEGSIVSRFINIYDDEDKNFSNAYYDICAIGNKAFLEFSDYDYDIIARVVWEDGEYFDPSDEDEELFEILESNNFDHFGKMECIKAIIQRNNNVLIPEEYGIRTLKKYKKNSIIVISFSKDIYNIEKNIFYVFDKDLILINDKKIKKKYLNKELKRLKSIECY